MKEVFIVKEIMWLSFRIVKVYRREDDAKAFIQIAKDKGDCRDYEYDDYEVEEEK